MGYLISRLDRTGKTRHTAMYRDARGKLRSAGTFSNARAAERAWQKAEADLAAGRITSPLRGRQTLRGYVTEEWFPNHVVEATTRESYTYLLDRYILPGLGDCRMVELLPADVREWVNQLQTVHGARPPTVRKCKVILDAILTTALNDQITFLHAGKGVKTPPVATKPREIITAQQFDRIHAAIEDPTMQLLVETDVETGLRWGELTEIRVKDIDFETGVITVSRAVVHLRSRKAGAVARFVVKDYPKDREWRRVRIDGQLNGKLRESVAARELGADDLVFPFSRPQVAARRTLPEVLPDPATLGFTVANELGRTYLHGTTTAYAAGRCRCVHCRNAVAAYRAGRRKIGKDHPGPVRVPNTDGHVPNDWFRNQVWKPALRSAGIDAHITPHGLRHAHASWLLAGGADLQVVKERLGHGSIVTTEKYLHSLPDAQDVALAALSKFRGRIEADTVPAEPAAGDDPVHEMGQLLARMDVLRQAIATNSAAG